MATSRLNLTRDQLASFLQDHEQIKQFERLFALVNELQPTTLNDLSIAAGNAEQKAIEALDLIASFAQTSAIDTAVADQKGTQALTALSRIADALELLASAPTTASQCIAQDDLTPPVSVTHAQDDLTPPLQLPSAQDDLTPPAERHNSIDYLDFNPLGPVPTDKTGRVYWSDDDATLDVMLEGGVTGQVCQQLDFHPKNTSGVQINKGQAVMATGVVGSSTKITCAKAVANGSVPAQYMLGIAAQNIPANSFGYVVWFGSVRGFNTTGANKTVPEVWVDGDILYFDPVYPGELTKVEPVAPNLDLPIAIVTSVGNNGSIFVRMKTGESLDELHDVHAPTPAAGDLLAYDAIDARWENFPASSLSVGKATNLAGGLTGSLPYQSALDTTTFLGIGAANRVLTSSGTAPQWSTALTGLTGVSTTTLSASSTVTLSGGTANGVLYLDGSKVATSGTDLVFNATGLGIGTSSPSRKLDVQGVPISVGGNATGVLANFVNNSTAFNASPTVAISLWNRINSGGTTFPSAVVQAGKENATDGDYAGYLSLQTTDAGGTSTEHVRLTSTGNLGLGVMPSASWSGQSALQVNARSAFAGSSNFTAVSTNAIATSNGWAANYLATGTAALYTQSVSTGAHFWYTAPSGTAGNAITFTEAARVTETNNQVAYQPAESAQNTSVTLTVANLQTRIITSNAAVTLTLPTGTSLEGYTTSMATDTAFECTFIATTANAITIGANGNTTVGSLTVAGNSSGLFRFRKTATNTFTVYRIA